MLKKLIFLLCFLPTLAFAQTVGLDLVSVGNITTGDTFNNFELNGATDQLEWAVQVPEAATITTIKFRYGLRTGTPVQYKIGLQSIGTNGRPTGTFMSGTGECSASFTPPADTSWDGTWRTVTLTGTTCAVTRGQFVGVMLIPVGTPDGSNKSSFTKSRSDSASSSLIQDTGIQNWAVDAGTPTQGNWGFIGLSSSTKTYGFVYGSSQADYRINSTDWAATKFRIEGNCKFNVRGVRVRPRFWGGGSSDTIEIALFTGTTKTQNIVVDKDSIPTTDGFIPFYFDESSLTDLDCGTDYYIAAQVSSGSAYTYCADVPVNQDFDTWPMGKNTYYSTRTTGAWTDTNTRRCWITPIIDISGSGSSAGAIIRNLMGGGL